MFLTDVEHDLLGADRVGGQDRAVDHEVGPVGHQHTILVARGLPLGAVRDDDSRAVHSLRERSPFASDREAGAASTQQPARLERVDDVPRFPGSVGFARACARCASSALRRAIKWRAGQQAFRGSVRRSMVAPRSSSARTSVAWRDGLSYSDEARNEEEGFGLTDGAVRTAPGDDRSPRHVGRTIGPMGGDDDTRTDGHGPTEIGLRAAADPDRRSFAAAVGDRRGRRRDASSRWSVVKPWGSPATTPASDVALAVAPATSVASILPARPRRACHPEPVTADPPGRSAAGGGASHPCTRPARSLDDRRAWPSLCRFMGCRRAGERSELRPRRAMGRMDGRQPGHVEEEPRPDLDLAWDRHLHEHSGRRRTAQRRRDHDPGRATPDRPIEGWWADAGHIGSLDGSIRELSASGPPGVALSRAPRWVAVAIGTIRIPRQQPRAGSSRSSSAWPPPGSDAQVPSRDAPRD